MKKFDGKKILVYMLIYDDDIISDKVMNNSKLMWQIKGFETLGLDVWYFLYGKAGIYLCNKDTKIKVMNSVGGSRGFVHRHFMNKALMKVLKRHNDFEYAYVRKMVSIPSYVSALRKLKKCGIKIAVEIPTYSKSRINEDVQSGRKFRVAIAPILSKIEKKTFKYIDLYALIGDTENVLFGIPAININNGINALSMDDFPKRKHDKLKNNECHMIALGHMRAYHGLERIIEGIKAYYDAGGEKEVFLHIVGSDADGSVEKNLLLAKELGVEDYVINEGVCYKEELKAVIDKCDVAFCALGYYKKGGVVGNELKTREYMMHGIPFVMAVPDNVLPEDAEYIFRVENKAGAINISELLEFLGNCPEDCAEKMQKFAFDNMTWMPELEKVLMRLDEIK